MMVMSGFNSVSLTGEVVDLGDCAVARLLGVRVDERAHARGHRIAFDALVAPSVQIVDDVVGGERIAIVPGHALADVKDIFGRVSVDVPAFEQHRPEGELARISHEGFEELTRDVAHLRPVVGARVLLILDEHAASDDAALLGRVGERRRRIGEAKHAVGGRGRDPENAGEGEKLAPVDRAFPGFGGPNFQALPREPVPERFPDHCLLPVRFKPSRRLREDLLSKVAAERASAEIVDGGDVQKRCGQARRRQIRRCCRRPPSLMAF